jgi:glyceraldehyde 3-phosphate dehydrogenase
MVEAYVVHRGSKRVLVSAQSPDAPTFVFGVYTSQYSRTNPPTVVPCASCTTNCLAPMSKVLNDEFGILQGLMTTVHASTGAQHVLEGYSKGDRRASKF